eukprot:jgi/Astpho2/7372/Aster-01963
MGTKKRKPQPLVAPVKSMKRARFLTSSFHKLTHQVAICASPSLTGRIQPREWLVQAEEAAASGDAIKAQKLDQQVSELGGRAAYQAASELTTSKHRVSKWVFSVLTELGLRPSKGQPPLPLLEIRAVNTQLLSIPWLETRAIDLRPCLPSIQKQDFLSLHPRPHYQVVVCSMVLNCVPTAAQRGDMLRKMRAHLRPGGLAFVMLPLRCLDSSPFMTWQHFENALAALGLQVIRKKSSPKVAFMCAKAIDPPAAEPQLRKKFGDPPPRLARDGSKTNEFAVSLDK